MSDLSMPMQGAPRVGMSPPPGIHFQVAERAAARPHSRAVQDTAGAELSYHQLWERSGWLSAALTAAGVHPKDRVAVAIDRSIGLVIALLGIARAGAAAVPLDPRAPEERLRRIVEESGASTVVTAPGQRDGTLPAGLPETVLPTMAPTTGVPEPVAVPWDAALYVGYTSGSTGRPKGAVISHRAVHAFTRSPRYCPVRPEDRVANLANPAFDATTFEIWNTLVAGATIVVLPPALDIPVGDWAGLLRDSAITTMFLTTALFDAIARQAPDSFSSLDTLMFGGELADAETVRRVCAGAPPRRLLHVYGPTETTTFASYFICTTDTVAGLPRIPIGFPVQDSVLRVLDADLRPVEPGESGELCIGGPQVAEGYLGDPEQTAARFAELPDGQWIYRSGDLVQQRPDDALDFLGRIDRQVKLRGFRIEPEEVELAALGSGLVTAVVVEKVGEGPAAQLTAFVQPAEDSGDGDLTALLTAALRALLPEYMVPTRWVLVPRMPLNANGKVDRNQLLVLAAPGETPAPAQHGETDQAHSRDVLGVLAELLKVAEVRPEDNFLELGGNSILALQASARLRSRLGVQINAADLLFSETVQELADHITALPPTDGPS